jgi:hypothetical protein
VNDPCVLRMTRGVAVPLVRMSKIIG